jgi:RNA-directed DNA polymerase
VEPRFHPDSYGYRPGKSALDAVGTCRRRCWEFDWIIDLDVQKFFDTVPWDLVVKAVQAVTDCRWVLLYVKRWLAAPLQHPDGTLVSRLFKSLAVGEGGWHAYSYCCWDRVVR